MTPPKPLAPSPTNFVCEPELEPALEVTHFGTTPAPLVFSSPHSGRIYPAQFLHLSRLNPMSLRRSEDMAVDELFTPAARLCAAPLVRAHFPRAYLDANREPYELDPRMFDAPLPSFVNTRSIRVAAGLGTIPRLVDEGQLIYNAQLPVHEIDRRLALFYTPYHAQLHELISSAYQTWGQALLIDCHSMPSTQSACSETHTKADIVLGDRYGSSCHPDISACLEQSLRLSGYRVERNTPYAGGFITQHYGAPARGRHAIQIEINRALYMDEKTLTLHATAHELSAHLASACRSLHDYFGEYLTYEAAE